MQVGESIRPSLIGVRSEAGQLWPTWLEPRLLSLAMRGSIQKRGKSSWRVRAYVGVDDATGTKRTVSRTVRGTKRDAEEVMHRLLLEAASKFLRSERDPAWRRRRRGTVDALAESLEAGGGSPGGLGSGRVGARRVGLGDGIVEFLLAAPEPVELSGVLSRCAEPGLGSGGLVAGVGGQAA